MKKILAINAGSSSFKFKAFSYPSEKVVCKGLADRIGIQGSTFELDTPDGKKYKAQEDIPNIETAIEYLLKWLKQYQIILDMSEIVGVGHRVVNGGPYFKQSTLITEDNIEKIYDIADMAPLHNAAEANGIRAFMHVLPDVPQVAVFDTSFHRTIDPVHFMYALPYEYYERDAIRKYGAHGTSVYYIVNHMSEKLNKPVDQLNMIVCHLGGGASLTAVKNGKSYDTSMGFSPLAGVPMGTRTGDIDPSMIPRLMEREGLSLEDVTDIFENKSGFLGISGVSSDVRDVREAAKTNKRAKLALDMFCNRVVRYIGAYYTEMGGADTIVFTAGIGEHEPLLRKKILEDLQVLGVKLGEEANEKNGEHKITTDDSKIAAYVVPTNEELMIEREVVRVGKIK